MRILNKVIAPAVVLFGRLLSAQAPAPMSRDSIALVIRDRVEAGRASGLVVGVIRPDGTRDIAAFGQERAGTPLDAQSVFEIGSITKVFTGILLAEMAGRGEVRLDQPVAELLPATVMVPSRGGKQITLADLSMQVSGLPRLPGNMQPANPDNPYADYSVQQLYDFISSHELRREPGAQYEYSNLGVGLLGHALALRAGKPYETLLRERVLAPLGMTSTAIVLDDRLRARLAEGHDLAGKVVSPWDLPTLAGAGALRSTLDDMLRFAAAVLAPPDDALGRAIALSQQARYRVSGALSLGLNWHRLVMSGDTIVWHNGGTGGFHSFLGVNSRTRTAVVLLENSASNNEDLAHHILVPAMKLVTIPRRTAVTLPKELLGEYVGRYQVGPQFALHMTLEGDALVVQATNQPALPVFAEARDRFFYKVVDAQLEFARDSTGAVDRVILHQAGNRVEARRVR